MITLIIVCALLLLFSILFCRRRWYAPTLLLTAIWLLSIAFYAKIDHGLHPLTHQTTTILIIWLVAFCLSAWTMQSVYIKPFFKDIHPNPTIREAYFYLTLCTLPIMIFEMIWVMQHSGGNLFSALRDANVSGVQGIRTTGFFVIFWIVSYILELQVATRERYGRVIVLFAVNLFYAFLSMGKMNFMILFLATAIILSKRQLIRVPHLAIGCIVLLFTFVGIQKMRGSYTNPSHFTALYFTSSLANLNTNTQPQSSEHWGENTFRLYYAIKAKIDGGRTQPINPVLDFKRVEVGEHVFGSNTYTALYPFYKDFGKTGVVIFAILLGTIFGYLFKAAEDGSECAMVLYAILAGVIVMQIIGDTFFTVLSQNIQYLIAVILPYLPLSKRTTT